VGKASTFRDLTADHAIVEMLLLLFACVLASAPAFATTPVLNLSRKTIQEQCDVRFGRPVEQAQALCILSRAGMPQGIAAWDVTDWFEGEERFWSVSTPLTQPQDGCFEALFAGVRSTDGIIAWFSQGEVCGDDRPLPPFSKPSHSETPSTPSIQTQCGIRPSREVTRDQAACVAERAGVMRDISTWLIDDEPDSWEITIPLHRTVDGIGDLQYELSIQKSDGRILRMGHYGSGLVR